MNILGVRIDTLKKAEALLKVAEFLHGFEQKMIFTPNPEMLVDAQKDSYFKEILNAGDLNICDGFGIALFAKEKVTRISGSDFMLDICALAEKENKSVYLLGSGFDSVVKKCREKLLEKFPDLKIVGVHKGPDIVGQDAKMNQDQIDEIVHDIILSSPDILFVAFGHGKQEKWIYEFLPELPSIKIAMGVGGTFDFISGKIRRAPRILRSLGLEWLYRLVHEPRRIKRIYKAVVVFPFLLLKNK